MSYSQRLRHGRETPNHAAQGPIPDRFAVAIPTLNRYDLLTKCLDAVAAQTRQPECVILVDNGNQYQHRENYPLGFYRLNTSENQGVAGSWNLAMAHAISLGLESVVLINDDCDPNPDTFEKLYRYPETVVVCGPHVNAFSCFRIDRPAFEAVGPFDERIFPAYLEDNDYARRCLVAGVPIRVAQGIAISHLGSQTIQAVRPQDREDFLREASRRDYYCRKWGGGPRRELFEVPFDGQS